MKTTYHQGNNVIIFQPIRPISSPFYSGVRVVKSIHGMVWLDLHFRIRAL